MTFRSKLAFAFSVENASDVSSQFYSCCSRNIGVLCGFAVFYSALDNSVDPRQRMKKERKTTTDGLALEIATWTVSVCVAHLTL